MHIREKVTKHKKTGKAYTKHVLMESVRAPKGPRQRTVMPLGKLELPREQWKVLAACLERKPSGQQHLDQEDPLIEQVALHALSQYRVVQQKRDEKVQRQEKRFLEKLAGIAASVTKGTLKRKEKVWHRIGRAWEKHPSAAKYYSVNTQEEGGDVTSLSWELNTQPRQERSTLTGAYVIEATHRDLSARDIWKLYMTLLQVESAFRCLKSDLGLRPIYHRKNHRTQAHLFIGVLAYHLLITLEH